MKKYAFTLMELMIGLSLIAIAIGIIFSSLFQNSLLQKKLDQGQEIIMLRARTQERLDQIFLAIDRGNRSPLYTDDKNILHVFFNHGIDPNPHYSHIIPAMLELKDKNLILTLIGGPTYRTEILRKGVSSLSFEFLTSNKKEIKAEPEWKKETVGTPLFMKMTLEVNREKEEYAFWINGQNEEIPIQ
ncbi:MAG: type II secretion system protein [Chlamydiia bacterium]|nr:type II secretion system protein [Chlamydiia bacterium]